MSVNRNDYAFGIDVKPVYISGENNVAIPVVILGNKRLAVVRSDTGDVLDIVSEHYEGVTHDAVVDSVKTDIMPKLGWEIVDEHLNMWMNGAIMYYGIQTEYNFTINNTKLFATINAVNSHNRFTKAGVHITLRDEAGTNYLPTVGSKAVYTYESMLHRKSTLDIVKLQKLVDNIPVLINTTVNCWRNWVNEYVAFPRVYILAQLFNYRLGEYLVEQMPTGGNRFDMYKHICQYMLNSEKMSASGFNSLTAMSKFVNIMRTDKLFTIGETELKDEIKRKQIFAWEDKVKTKEEKEAEKTDTVINVADISSGEEIVIIDPSNVESQVDDMLGELI